MFPKSQSLDHKQIISISLKNSRLNIVEQLSLFKTSQNLYCAGGHCDSQKSLLNSSGHRMPMYLSPIWQNSRFEMLT